MIPEEVTAQVRQVCERLAALVTDGLRPARARDPARTGELGKRTRRVLQRLQSVTPLTPKQIAAMTAELPASQRRLLAEEFLRWKEIEHERRCRELEILIKRYREFTSALIDALIKKARAEQSIAELRASLAGANAMGNGGQDG